MIAGTHRDPDGLKRLLHLARMNWLGHQYCRIGVEALLQSRLKALTMSVLETTPSATPSLSHTMIRGVSGWARIVAMSWIECSGGEYCQASPRVREYVLHKVHGVFLMIPADFMLTLLPNTALKKPEPYSATRAGGVGLHSPDVRRSRSECRP